MSNETISYGATPTDEPVESPNVADGPAPDRKLLIPLLIGALVFSFALAATFAVLWAQARDTSSSDVDDFLAKAAPDVEQRTRVLVDALANYDAATLEQRTKDVLALSTGNFRQDYQDAIDQGLGAALEEASASSRGQIIEGPDIYFNSPSEAIALVRTSQTTQSRDNPGGQTFTYVMKITMINTPEGWKADDVELLSQNSA
jgi:hypothetical protein